MTNIDIIGMDRILLAVPKGYRLVRNEELVAIDDLICNVSIENMLAKAFKISWMKPDTIGEIGKLKKFRGQIVIRLDSDFGQDKDK